MKHINFIYGILTNGELPENTPFFRFSNVSRSVMSKAAVSYLNTLLSDDVDIRTRAATADSIIRILQSYDNYEQLINEIDPVNTYDVDCIVDDATRSVSFNAIYEWALKCPFRLNDVYAGPLDDPITTIQKTVFALCQAVK